MAATLNPETTALVGARTATTGITADEVEPLERGTGVVNTRHGDERG